MQCSRWYLAGCRRRRVTHAIRNILAFERAVGKKGKTSIRNETNERTNERTTNGLTQSPPTPPVHPVPDPIMGRPGCGKSLPSHQTTSPPRSGPRQSQNAPSRRVEQDLPRQACALATPASLEASWPRNPASSRQPRHGRGLLSPAAGPQSSGWVLGHGTEYFVRHPNEMEDAEPFKKPPGCRPGSVARGDRACRQFVPRFSVRRLFRSTLESFGNGPRATAVRPVFQFQVGTLTPGQI